MVIDIKDIKVEGFEKVIYFEEKELELKGYIAVHNTKLGPSLGGLRIVEYKNNEDALEDVLRLARGMTLKSASADLKLGGGKAVIIGNNDLKSEEYFKAFGEVIESLDGLYITAEDMNSTTEDMVMINEVTDYVTGLPGKSGDPSPITALGAIKALEAALTYKFSDKTFKNYSYAVQGAGSTGREVIRHLYESGVRDIYYSEINQKTIEELKVIYPEVKLVSNQELLTLNVDVFVPCARGGILSPEVIGNLNVKIISGTANNVLLDEERDSKLIKEKGILYAPDFIVNAGGIINVFYEIIGYDRDLVIKDLDGIYNRLLNIFETADKLNITTHEAALKYALDKLN